VRRVHRVRVHRLGFRVYDTEHRVGLGARDAARTHARRLIMQYYFGGTTEKSPGAAGAANTALNRASIASIPLLITSFFPIRNSIAQIASFLSPLPS
jgi:hypothetical protein